MGSIHIWFLEHHLKSCLPFSFRKTFHILRHTVLKQCKLLFEDFVFQFFLLGVGAISRLVLICKSIFFHNTFCTQHPSNIDLGIFVLFLYLFPHSSVEHVS